MNYTLIKKDDINSSIKKKYQWFKASFYGNMFVHLLRL